MSGPFDCQAGLPRPQVGQLVIELPAVGSKPAPFGIEIGEQPVEQAAAL